jgi:Tfp pilus assembly protein PilX
MTHVSPARERGVVLIFTLIVLLIMTIGAVALLRSMNTSLTSAGNLAFRHDLVNQGEQAISNVLQSVQTGALATGTTADVPSSNYYAATLDTNAQGVPTVLLTRTAPSGMTAGDITGATSDVKIRYVVDRLCNAAGAASAASCVQFVANPLGQKALPTPGIPAPSATVYRLSVRVTGPRNTQIFLQTTFTKPD